MKLWPDTTTQKIVLNKIGLYEHQKEVIDKIKNGSILCGGVGSGKSLTSLYFFVSKILEAEIDYLDFSKLSRPKKSIPLYIITTSKKRDSKEWDMECSKIAIYPNDAINSITKHKTIVDSWNNVEKYVGVMNAFFIFDEHHAIGKGSWAKSLIKISKNNKFIILSATPGDIWMDYATVFIANNFYKDRYHFEREHVVYKRFVKYPAVDYYINVDKLNNYRNKVVVNMEYTKPAVRHIHMINCTYDKEEYLFIEKNWWDPVNELPIKDKAELCRKLRLLVNQDNTRIEACLNIFYKHSKVIIFYTFHYELILLRNMCENNNIVYSEYNGLRHQEIPETDSWIYLVQYTAGSEGWNCIKTDCMVLYSLSYSYKQTEQAYGRIDRLNTPYKNLHYYRLISNSKMDLMIDKTLTQKKNFNNQMYFTKK